MKAVNIGICFVSSTYCSWLTLLLAKNIKSGFDLLIDVNLDYRYNFLAQRLFQPAVKFRRKELVTDTSCGLHVFLAKLKTRIYLNLNRLHLSFKRG